MRTPALLLSVWTRCLCGAGQAGTLAMARVQSCNRDAGAIGCIATCYRNSDGSRLSVAQPACPVRPLVVDKK